MAAVPEDVQIFCTKAQECVILPSYTQWGHKLDEYPGSMADGVRFLQEIKENLSNKLKELVSQQQWDKVVIAFYGETNAGKSTLIEALCSWFEEQGQSVRTGSEIGASIGDGRSDFTRHATAYKCVLQGQAFTLLDVPGIEGQEKIVQDEIDRAISQAHIVFYVTSEATPPQTSGGDKTRDGRNEDIEGTLEKIRKQLRAEAQVYRIFNKRVNSTRVLDGGLRISAEEKETLRSSDGYMAQILGNAYRGHITLAALPAFFAMAGNLPQDHRLARKQGKFLKAMPATELWQFSGAKAFISKLQNEILPESQHIIRIMNMSKLRKVVEQEAGDPLEKNIDKYLHSLLETKGLLQKAVKEYGFIPKEIALDYKQLTSKFEEHFVNGVRERMEKHHKDRLWLSFDATVQKILKQEVEAELKELVSYGKPECEVYAKRSRERVEKVDQRIRRVLEQDRENSVNDFQFATESLWGKAEIDTDKGIDAWGIGGTVLSVIVGAFLGPVGWFEIAISAAGGLWSARKLLSPEYQEEQQRTSIESVLDKIRPNLREKIQEGIQKVGKPIARYALDKKKEYEKMESDLDEVVSAVKDTQINMERFLLQKV